MLKSSYLILLALFLILFAMPLVQDGMFIDGVCYAALSKNLANDIGSLWSLKLSDTMFSQFNEHPPLMFGIQSLFFRLFGSGYGTERVYCAVVVLLTMFLMARIWRNVFRNTTIQDWWPLPLFFWILNEETFMRYTSNMLECIMTLFDLGAVALLLRAYPLQKTAFASNNRLLYVLGAGLLLVAAFLTKGPAGLFPLAFWGIYAWSSKMPNWKTVFSQTVLLTAVVLAGIGAFFMYEPARIALTTYFDQQVMAAIHGKRMENIAPHRLYMVQRFFEIHAHFIILLGVAWFFIIRRKGRTIAPTYWSAVLFFMGMGAIALLPVMVSLKQAPHYIVPSLPWFALGFGAFLAAVFVHLKTLETPRWLLPLSIVFAVAAACLTYSKVGITRKDLAEIKPFFSFLPPHSTIGFFAKEEALVRNNYFQRYNFNALDGKNTFYKYLIYDKALKVPNEVLFTYQQIVFIGDYVVYMRK
jgi:hypothetical protein